MKQIEALEQAIRNLNDLWNNDWEPTREEFGEVYDDLIKTFDDACAREKFIPLLCTDEECKTCGLARAGAFDGPNGCRCFCHPECRLVAVLTEDNDDDEEIRPLITALEEIDAGDGLTAEAMQEIARGALLPFKD